VASPSAAWAGFEQMPDSLSGANPQLLGAASKVTLYGVEGKVRLRRSLTSPPAQTLTRALSPPALVWRRVPSVGACPRRSDLCSGQRRSSERSK